MAKTYQAHELPDETAGYSLHRTREYASVGVLLPTQLVAQIREEVEAAAQARLDKEDAPDPACLLKSTPPAPSAPLSDEEMALEAAVDRPNAVSVINMQDVREAAAAATTKTKTADMDRNKMMVSITKKLIETGPSRDIARPLDRHAAIASFLLEAPHMRELADVLRVALEVSAVSGKPPRIDPILLVGRPGVGKTHVADVIARTLGTERHTINYAAQGSAGNTLSGADKSWYNACAGQVFNALAEGLFANPLILLDELDKTSPSMSTSGRERDPLSELLPLLEPITAREHKDRCVEIRVDASYLIYVATANSLSGFPAALLSRFKIIEIKQPSPREALELIQAIATAVLTDLGLVGQVKPPRGPVARCMCEMSPRMMRRTWTASVGIAIAAGRNEVQLDDLERALGIAGPSKILH